jgi:hypothetical protein
MNRPALNFRSLLGIASAPYLREKAVYRNNL